jgi:hypothetical protein
MLWLIGTHLSPDSAASCVGIRGQTLNDWLRYALQYDEASPDTPLIGAACSALSDRLKRAWDWAEQSALAKIAASPQWQASAWLLERTRQGTYALQSAVQVGQVTINIGVIATQGQDQKRLEIDVDNIKRLPDPRRQAIDVQAQPVLTSANPSDSNR